MAKDIIITGYRPDSVRSHLDRLRERRTLPQGTPALIEHFRRLAAKRGSDEIVDAIQLLANQGMAQAVEVLYAVCDNARNGYDIFSPLLHMKPALAADLASGMHQIDTDRGTSHTIGAISPLVATKIDYLYYLYKSDPGLASALLRTANGLLCEYNILNFCFGNRIERFPSDDERIKMGRDIVEYLSAQYPAIIPNILCRFAHAAKANLPDSFKYYDIILKVLENLPDSHAARLAYSVYQNEREAFAEICSYRSDFPSAGLMTELFGLDKAAAVFALNSVHNLADVARHAYSMLGILGKAPSSDDLSPQHQERIVSLAATESGQHPSVFIARNEIERAHRVERFCRDNPELLKAFLAILDPESVNTVLLIHGLFIWDTADAVGPLGWKIDMELWKIHNAIRLLREELRLPALCESYEKIIERFAAKPRTEGQVHLFTDVLTIVAKAGYGEYIAKLFDKVAQRNPQLETLLQNLANEIDRKKEANNIPSLPF